MAITYTCDICGKKQRGGVPMTWPVLTVDYESGPTDSSHINLAWRAHICPACRESVKQIVLRWVKRLARQLPPSNCAGEWPKVVAG